MSTTFANTINGNPLYAARAETDQDGLNIKQNYIKLADLAIVATSGSYNDLTDKPFIPTKTSDLTNDSGFITASQVPTQVQANWTESDAANPSYIQNKPDFFIAQYGVTTYAQILAAYNAGINVLCSYGSSTDRMLGILGYAYINNSHALASRNFEFAYFKPKNHDKQATDANQGIAEIETWKVYGNNTWESASKVVSPLIAPGTGISTSYSSSSRTLTVEVSSAVRAGAASGSTAVQPEDLATVATSGSWNDLSDKPTIPVVPTTDQTYDAASSNPQSGTAVAGAIAGVNQVPASTSSDEGKVLTVDSLGIPSWAAVPQQSTGLFEAVYGSTTYSEIRNAVKNKQIVYCRINKNTSTSSRMAFLAYIGTTTYEFQYYRSISSHTYTSQVDEVYIYTCTRDGWTTTIRTIGSIVAAGTNMNYSYTSGILTLNADAQLPTSTTSDSGKVLTVNSSGTPEWATGGGTQQQADWAQTDSSAVDYIKNKPAIPATWVSSRITLSKTGSGENYRYKLNQNAPAYYIGAYDTSYGLRIQEQSGNANYDWDFYCVTTNPGAYIYIYDSDGNLATGYDILFPLYDLVASGKYALTYYIRSTTGSITGYSWPTFGTNRECRMLLSKRGKIITISLVHL